MPHPQPGILASLPPHARYLEFALVPGGDPATALGALRDAFDAARGVVGIGPATVAALGATLPGLHPFTSLTGPGVEVPATHGALWLWLRGDDRGELLHRTRTCEALLAPGFELDNVVEAFTHADCRDLTGYEDGTENPEGDAALAAATVTDAGSALRGSSFVAVQQWLHDLDAFDAMDREAQDATIGRHRESNEEFDAPPSAHVKRTAQESFEPEAFVVRRSMPWSDGVNAGLVFVAFGHSLDAFEALLRRMAGLDDGITDALFRFTRPLTGASYWCPALRDGRLDLVPLGL
jgi:putative iron-dependent peroxidase